MLLIDANAVLRYILNDNSDMANKVEELLDSKTVTLRNEILAEVVYVLEKVYKLPRDRIHSVIVQFLDLENTNICDKAVILLALETFAQTRLDFVDTLLYAYHTIEEVDIFTFDKKLITILLSPVRNVHQQPIINVSR